MPVASIAMAQHPGKVLSQALIVRRSLASSNTSPDRVSQRLSVSLATSIPITATWLVMTNSDEEDGDHLSGLTMAQACRYCRYERLLNPMDSLSALVVSAWAGEVSHRLACRSGLCPSTPDRFLPYRDTSGPCPRKVTCEWCPVRRYGLLLQGECNTLLFR